MMNYTMDDLLGFHTEEIKEKAKNGMENFEFFLEDLTDREKKIFEIAFANGYSDSNNDSLNDEQVQVLK